MTEVSDRAAESEQNASEPWLSRRKAQEFVIAIIVFNFIPLAPLVIEWLRSGTIKQASMMLGVSIFAISTGFSSRFKIVFTLSVVFGFMLSALLGEPSAGDHPPVDFRSLAWLVLCVVAVMNTIERFVRHMFGSEAALLFVNQGGGK